jgi:hypothetical protein
MRDNRTLGFVCVVIFLGGCASYSANNANVSDEQIDLYLSTLDDKHFVWCQLDPEVCRKDFEEWKGTARGRMIIKEFDKEDSGQAYNTHHLPNVFRTRFVDENQFPKEMVGEHDSGQSFSSNSQESGRALPHIDKRVGPIQEGLSLAPEMYGPDVRPSGF